MKNQSLLGLFLASIVSFANPAFAALIITEVNNADILANEILGTGTSNVSGATYTGVKNNSGSQFGTAGFYSQAGIFTGGLSTGFEFDTGIFLSTGFVLDDRGDGNLSSSLGGNGDSDLTDLVNTQRGAISLTTQDAAILEFSFDFAGGDLVFNYIFASDEYNEWVGTGFGDVFGFFLDGENIALTTDQPLVSVDTFNNNTGSFNDNTGGAFPDVLFDGFTYMLTAKKEGLAAGNYTAKIGIADVGTSIDGLFDSGVFIQSNSFSDGPVPVPVPFSALLFASGLFGLAGTKRFLKRS